MPWRAGITREEKERFEGEAWIRERLDRLGVGFDQQGENLFALPLVVREEDRRLVCAFLDEDGLCSQYRHHGRDFWSRTCKTFPP